jgi:hypothetical protein
MYKIYIITFLDIYGDIYIYTQKLPYVYMRKKTTICGFYRVEIFNLFDGFYSSSFIL